MERLRNKNRILGCIVCVLLLSLRAYGVELTFEQCVDSALVNNPAVMAAALSVEKSRVLKGTAFDPDFTSITLQQNAVEGGGMDNGVTFSQEFDFPTAYVARYKVLSERTRLEESRFRLLSSEVERDVAAVYNELLYYAELQRLNTDLGRIYDEFCNVAAIRVEAGESSALELMNARRVRENNRMDSIGLAADYMDRLTELRRLTGCADAEVSHNASLSIVSGGMAGNGFSFEDSPLGLVSLGEIKVAEREVASAKNDFLPGIQLGATVQAVIKGFNPYHVERLPFDKGNFMGFEVGISVPLFFGASSSRLKAANIEKRISLLNFEAVKAETLSAVEAAESRIALISSRLDVYRKESLPRAREIERLAAVSYEYGDIDYLEYIANMDTAYKVYAEYAQCINDYNQEVIKFNSLVTK